MKRNYRSFFQSYDISTIKLAWQAFEKVPFPSPMRAYPVPARLNLREELLGEDGGGLTNIES